MSFKAEFRYFFKKPKKIITVYFVISATISSSIASSSDEDSRLKVPTGGSYNRTNSSPIIPGPFSANFPRSELPRFEFSLTISACRCLLIKDYLCLDC
jgi:hypothetical protein